jgi:hypothetical protein
VDIAFTSKIDLNYLGTGKRFVRCDTKSLKMPIAFPWALNDSTTRKTACQALFCDFLSCEFQSRLFFVFLVYALIFECAISKNIFAAKLKKHSFSAVFRESRAFYVFYSAITFSHSALRQSRARRARAESLRRLCLHKYPSA